MIGIAATNACSTISTLGSHIRITLDVDMLTISSLVITRGISAAAADTCRSTA